VVVLAILAAAALARSIDIGRNPPGLFVDEAFKGYDAYSLLKTGQDLWGERLPIFFRSWGDYNSGLYRYLTVPWVALLGLTEAAVRATGVLFGTLTILAVFLLGRRLLSEKAGLAAAALLAVSPWHFQFSRSGFRGILLPFFLTVSALLFLRALERKRWWMVAAAAAFALSAYTYSAGRLVAPLLFACLLFLHRRALKGQGRAIAASALAFLLLLVPLARITLSGEGTRRYELISVFREAGSQAATPQPGGPTGVTPSSRAGATRVAATVAGNYVSHFDPRFLLLSGDVNLRHSPRGVGQLNWAEFAFFWVGVVVALSRRGKHLIALSWVLIAFIPGSLTTDNVPNALRAIGALPAVQLVAASGFVWLFARSRPLVLALVAIGLVGSALHFQNYFTRYRVEAAPWWDYGYRDAIAYCESVKDDYAGIVVVAPDRAFMRAYATNPYAYVFPLFYARVDPATLHRTKRPGKYAVVNAVEGARIEDAMLEPGILYVIRARQAGSVRPLRIVDYPSGEPAFVITARTRPSEETGSALGRPAAGRGRPSGGSETP